MESGDSHQIVDDQLVQLLFSGSERTCTADDEEYLASLTSYSLEKILEEPERLSQECKNIQIEMEQAAFQNYKTFLETGDCIREMHVNMKSIHGNLSSVSNGLPKLYNSCREFCSITSEIEQQRQRNKATLDRHTQLLEILEVPQLMDTCVRNGYYEEALQLQQFTAQLVRKHGRIPIIQSINDDVKTSSEIMLSQLHHRLRTNIQVTECLRIIGFLRRLDVYEETQLRIVFLKCRDGWLQSQVEQISTQNPYTYLNKLTDQTRANLFDIITQYRAIFSDSTGIGASSSTRDGGILYSWLVYKIDVFVKQVQRYLTRITDGGSVHNILDQCMYLGLSLSRVGVDFRGMLPSIFEPHIARNFSNSISAAVGAFIESLKTHDFGQSSRAGALFIAERGDSHSPSQQLLTFPPLAALTNGYLAAFNELRQCAPIVLQGALAKELEESLSSIACALKASFSKIPNKMEHQYSEMCKMFAELFLPFIESCFSHLFHSTHSLVDVSAISAIVSGLYEIRDPSDGGAV